jgi:predicted DsbA family dithiol-disulfide isomerase
LAGVVEVFADVVCPFTHVGLRRVVAERSRRGRDLEGILVRAWPLELVNGEAVSPVLIAEEVAELRRQVAPDLFAGFDPAAFPATALPALRLACRAYRMDARTGEQVSLALRTAVFEEGRDIADAAVLRNIAGRHGVPAERSAGDDEAVRAEWDEGRRRGVIGSPHFFASGQDFFCPSLHITRVDGHLHVRFDEKGLQDFLQACFP